MANGRIDLWHELQERRVLQLVGIYFGASWVALEFTGFLTDRYALSPNLIDLILLTMLAMLPSVIVMAWTHGKPGKDDWTRTEQVVLPANLAVTLALLFYAFSSKELGAATVRVSLENAAGEMVERVVPKSVYRKRVALFYFANETGSQDHNWAAWWMAYGMHIDLMQDVYFDSRGPYQLAAALVDAGAENGHAPLALMRQIASRAHKTYFLTGSIRSAEPFQVEVTLFRTKGGQPVASHEYEGENLGEIIDAASVDLKFDVELAEYQIKAADDLPVKALSSGDAEAVKKFAEGMQRLYFHSDYPGALKLLVKATRADPAFPQAQFQLYRVSWLMGKGNAEAIRAAMQYVYKVPERLQGEIKEVFYLWRGEPEQALQALQLDATLFPDDVVAHRRLARFYAKVGNYSEALAEYQWVRSLNPEDDLVLRDMAETYAATGQFRRALGELRQFARSNPRDGEVLMETGEVYQLLGESGNAAKMYARALLLGFNEAKIKSHQAQVLFQEGRYEEAIALAKESAEVAQSPDVKYGALSMLEDFYTALGRIAAGMEVARKNMSIGRDAFGPMNSIILRMNHFLKYAQTTLGDSVWAMLNQFDISAPPPWDQAIEVMLTVYKSQQETVPVPLVELARVEKFYSEYKYLVKYPQEEITGAIHLSNRDNLAAIQSLISALARYPRRLMVQRQIARAYRLLGDADAAMTTLAPLLEVFPHDPLVLYELYHIQLLDDPAAARQSLRRLSKIWEAADEIYLPARQIRADLAAIAAS
ncbi:MAG: tetratricopeptide repeat protein [Candidatus Marinimicrobia bacterium]|nr:tetratricopeptide repeat protein [Candidatus Neomarinimicrobiota bacterium]